MLFSVLIPVYNVEKYLEECIESILIQKIKDYEIILVNDGSVDNSGSICDYYKKKYPDFFTVIHKKNEGLLMARRDAVSVASGDYILFCDSDDYYTENAFEILKRTIDESNPDLILYNVWLVNKGERINKLNNYKFPHKKEYIENKDFIYDNLLLTEYNFSSLAMKCCRRECVVNERNYHEFTGLNYGEDLLQSIDIYTVAKKIIYIDEDIYMYRIGSGMMGKFNPRFYNDFKCINKIMKEYKDMWNIEDFNYKCAINYLNFAYGSIRQMSKSALIKKEDMRDFFKMISEDKGFIDSYKMYFLNKKFIMNIKEKIVLFLLFFKCYSALMLVVRLCS